MKKLHYLIISSLVLLVCACQSGQSYSDNIPTDNTVITRIAFVADDDNPGIENASFSIELIGDTGAMVVNKDSLPVGTKIDSVVTRFTFQYSVAGMILLGAKDTVALRNNDTIDFTHQPVHVRVISADYTRQRNYRISVLVHNANPELYKWTQLTSSAFDALGARQCAVMRGGRFYWLVSDGFANVMYTSEDGMEWMGSSVTSLPVQCDVRGLCAADAGLYIADCGTLYTSQDGVEWTAMTDKDYRCMLGEFDGGLWCAVLDNEGLLSAVDLLNDSRTYPLPNGFPVSAAAMCAYKSPAGREQFIAAGGVDINGAQLNSRWLTQDMRNWVNLSDGQPGYASFEGASIVYYGGRLLLIGGLDADGRLRKNFITQSYDDGLFWETVDDDNIALPGQIVNRAYCNAILSDDGYNLYLLGGMDMTKVYADVWRARKNSIDWQ